MGSCSVSRFKDKIMMFNQKLVASVKSQGKILREFGETVYLPFATEFSVLLKNLNTVRALVNVYIDGSSVVDGGLVLLPGQEIDLERWVKNGNLSEGNRFKFIERSDAVESHRGIKAEDGIVRIEYKFERLSPNTWNGPASGQLFRNSELGVMKSSANTMMNVSTATYATRAAASETGITVPGSISEQKFSTASWFPTESQSHSIVLRLLGETADNKALREPVTVTTKLECVTCGKKNKASSKFCSECGTSLQIVA
jgi:hypothetical protein